MLRSLFQKNINCHQKNIGKNFSIKKKKTSVQLFFNIKHKQLTSVFNLCQGTQGQGSSLGHVEPPSGTWSESSFPALVKVVVKFEIPGVK